MKDRILPKPPPVRVIRNGLVESPPNVDEYLNRLKTIEKVKTKTSNKYKVSNYLNIETLQEEYGIKIEVKGKWFNACEGNTPLIFKTEAEALSKIEELKQQEL